MELATAIERVEKGPLLAVDKAMAIASISATLDQTSTAISKAQAVSTRAFTIDLQPCCDQIIKLAKCLDTWIAMFLVLRAARPCCFSGPPTPFWSGPLEPVRPTNIAGPLVFTLPQGNAPTSRTTSPLWNGLPSLRRILMLRFWWSDVSPTWASSIPLKRVSHPWPPCCHSQIEFQYKRC